MQQTWTDPAWLAAVQGWAEVRLAELRRPVSGPWDQPHVRPWSTALRAETAQGPVWVKAAGPGTAFEPRLVAELARLTPSVPEPLAVDGERGWMLSPDAGGRLRDLDDDAWVRAWQRLLPAYAELQRAAAPDVERLAGLGLPDTRPDRLPRLLADVLDDSTVTAGLSGGELARIRALQDPYARWCHELAAGGVSPSVQHDDLHDGNVLVSGDALSVIDWGDTSIAHPFSTLLVTLRSIASRAGRPLDETGLVGLRDAYLEPWTDRHAPGELRRLADLAVAVAPLGRSLAWRRALTGAGDDELTEWWPAVPGWLEELGGPPPA